MALDSYIGLFSDESDWAAQVLAEIQVILAEHGLPPHHEPETAEDDAPRLGFYSSPKYEHLRSLIRSLALEGSLPPSLPEGWVSDDTLAAQVPGRWLRTLEASLSGLTFLLPQSFPAPLEGTGPEVGRIISAPTLIEEALLFRLCATGVEAHDWRWWDRVQAAEARGLRVPEAETVWASSEALDLVWRLQSWAQGVVRAGAVGWTG